MQAICRPDKAIAATKFNEIVTVVIMYLQEERRGHSSKCMKGSIKLNVLTLKRD